MVPRGIKCNREGILLHIKGSEHKMEAEDGDDALLPSPLLSANFLCGWERCLFHHFSSSYSSSLRSAGFAAKHAEAQVCELRAGVCLGGAFGHVLGHVETGRGSSDVSIGQERKDAQSHSGDTTLDKDSRRGCQGGVRSEGSV